MIQNKEIYQFTPNQNEIWFEQILHKNTPLYNIGGYLKIDGNIDVALFEKAINFLIKKHDALRLAIKENNNKNGLPSQYFLSDLSISLPIIDFSKKENPHQFALDWMQKRFTEPFDLYEKPLFRYDLLKIKDKQYYWLIQYHHLITDGWSIALMNRSLGNIYNALCQGKEPDLSSPSYIDYINRELKYTASRKFEDDVNYWEKQCQTTPSILFQPRYQNTFSNTSVPSQCHTFFLSNKLYARINDLAKTTKTSIFHIILGALYVYFSRTEQKSNLAIGLPVLNRQNAIFRNTAGLFVGICPVFFDFDMDISFTELVQNISQKLKQNYKHQRLPISEINQIAGINSEINRSQLFDLNVNYAKQDHDVVFNDASSRTITLNNEAEQTPLTVSIWEFNKSEDVQIDFSYNLTYFKKEEIEAIADRFSSILENISYDPDNRIDNISLLTIKEIKQLQDWNKTHQTYSKENVSINNLFETKHNEHPDAIAIIFEGKQFTYSEVNIKANQLAHYLVSNKQVKPDTLVGICLNRSPEMIVAILAILKAGGAYVPLEPHYPDVRLQNILDDAALNTVITLCDILPNVPVSNDQALCLDNKNIQQQLVTQPSNNPQINKLTDENLAYVIYTSGSTGKPKGVLQTHRTINNLVHSQLVGLKVDREVILQYASISFDVSIQELATAWFLGAKFIMTSAEEKTDFPNLLQTIKNQKVTILFMPPIAIKELAKAYVFNKTPLPVLKAIVSAGDQLNISKEINTLLDENNILLINHYGPTETHVVTENIISNFNNIISIGKPVNNTRLYVVDNKHKLQPIGVEGELLIGGYGIARGYLNRLELTAEKFVQNPFVDDKSERLYKTGDLVRWLSNGTLEFIGRADNQVNIRGFRIELGEIEHALLQINNVTEAVVDARDDKHGTKHLVAYIVSKIVDIDNINICRQQLNQILPNYMVPSIFNILEELPLTSSGKIDRKALPDPDFSQLKSEYIPPSTETECLLCEIWQNILCIEKVGLNDNFFQLGGHSLLLMQLIADLQKTGRNIDIGSLYGTNTLAELAILLDDIKQSTQLSFKAPANLIEEGCKQLTSDMLTMVDLDNKEIKYIESSVKNGCSNIQDIYPLSPLQEGILFHYQMNEGGGDPYIVPILLSAETDQHLKSFLEAFQVLINRHDVLRTAILWKNISQPVQVVYRHSELPITKIELDPLEESVPQLIGLMEPEKQFIDITQAPPLHIQVAKDPHSKKHFILLKLHHIATDHVGLEIIQSEIQKILEGESIKLETSVPYREFIAHTINQSKFADAKEFFKKKLDDIKEPTIAFGLSNVHSDGCSSLEVRQELSPYLANKIRSLSRNLEISPAALFHVAWALLISICSQKDNVVFGSVLSGRLQGIAGVDRMLGMFINTLPLRLTLKGVTVKEILLKTHEELVNLVTYEQTSLSLAQQCSGLPNDVPLFNTILNYRHSALTNENEISIGFGEKSGIELIYAQERTNYPLNVFIDDWQKGFRVTLQVDSTLNPQYLMGYLEKSITDLVQALLNTPEKNILDISILSEEEKYQQLVKWNDTHVEYPHDCCIHELFEEQVEKTPDAIALVFEDQLLTYSELNTKANQLAHYLVNEKQVKPDTLVGVCLERSLEMVVAILGIIKAGGAYVPLDPDYPKARLAYMLDDAGLTTVLAHSDILNHTPVTESQAVCLDDETVQKQLSIQRLDNLNVDHLTTEHLAYVIYTSGSTGNPKGVMVEHRAIVNRIHWMHEQYDATDQDVFLQKTPFSFDVSVWEFFWPLIAGSKLVMAKPQGHTDPNYLCDVIQRQHVTKLHFVPSMLSAMLMTEALKDCTSIRQVFCSGEALGIQQVNAFYQALPDSDLHNLYGPTEAAVDVSYWDCANIESTDTRIPIGRPINNIQLHVLDQSHKLVPQGVIGELHIGGVGLARGYLNREDLTQAKFIQNPFSDDPNDRLYKTGDLVRWLSDGNLEYIGRIDDQVKIRGFRIELGEIENTLLNHEDVHETVVIVRGEGINKRLLAYAVSNKDVINDWREYLNQSLPEYMLPSALLVLNKLPLTPNGKIDRKALPEPDFSQLEYEYIKPSTKTEELLCLLWQEILDIPKVGITDNFFHLGGHSLLATRLLSQINQKFNIALPLKILFSSNTIKKLAIAVDLAEPVIGYPKINPISRSQALVLSHAQQRLWLINQLDPSSAQYNMPAALQLSGHLNITALTHAFTTIIQRHESLRTVFTKQNEAPIQQIQPADTFEIPVVDLSALEIPEQTRQIQYLSKVEAHKPFDLTTDRMLRSQLLKLADNEHILLVTLHHIASDGWSIGILIRELSILYQAYTEGRDHPLPVLDIQYADYAHWQRQYLQGDVLEQQLHYWQQQLADLPVAHNIPLDYPRPKQQCFNGAVITTQIQPTLVTQLQQLCEQHEATLFMGLHAAFSVLLARYSNQTDIVVGTPIANREQAEVSELIGFFVNTLVLRSDVSDNISFIALLQQSKQTALEAYAHQQVPFEQLVETLQPVRSLSHSPLFQIMLVLQNTQTNNLELPGLTINELAREVTQTKFDLTLNIIENPQGLQLEWEYNTDLFKIDTIERMSGHFHRLLAQLLASPQDSVHSLSMLDDAEHQQLLVEWNDTRADYPDTDCIHERFEQQVEKTPDAIAVVFEDQQLTYRQLNQQANQLAHYLINKRHVTPDTLVGVCLDRSLEMVVSLLAVLKAGGAYVPLDPDYPAVRLEHMLEDAGLETVITCRPVLMRTPVIDDQALCLDDETVQEQLLLQPTVNIDVRLLGLTPDHLVYVVYTSGSTGQPKGVMVEHRSLVNLNLVEIQDFDIKFKDRVLHIISFNFDPSIGILFSALNVGATVYITIPNQDVCQFIKDKKITHATFPAALLTTQEFLNLPNLKVLATGGDQCSLTTINTWVKNHTYINLYGPTETTVTAIRAKYTNVINQAVIGQPINNVKVYVLNSAHVPVPIGISGELYIGGVGLARGYLNQPELTQEKFIQSPFSNDSSERLYKTGDLVRWLPDGNLEFLGRIDDQIKIRGFRVELGEIEHILCQHHIVKDVIVIAHTNTVNEKRLVAYVVTDTEVETDLLRQYVSKHLPDYMVPSAFILLDEFPLTSNGKVNRQALPEPDFTQSANEYIAPTTETEKILCEIWQEILGIKTVGVTDNFFYLGGHSLLATRAISRINHIFKVTLSVKVLFESNTVRGLIEIIDRSKLKEPLSAIEFIPRTEPLLPSYAQQRLWLIDQLNSGSSEYNMPAILNIFGKLDIIALNKAFTSIINRHESLRTTFVDKNDEPLQFVHQPIQEFKLSVINLSTLDEIQKTEKVKYLSITEAEKTFDLNKDLMLRAQLLELADDEYILLMTLHHIASDGWSIGILIKELNILYKAYLENRNDPLIPLNIQYADYAHWQRQHLQGEILKQQVSYWKTQLAELPVIHNLPLDHPRPTEQSFNGAILNSRISVKTLSHLKELCEQYETTLFMGLHAAFSILLARYSHETDIVVGSPIANREQVEISNLIGFFVNTLVLRSDLSGTPSFINLLLQSKQTTLDAYNHQQVPFEYLVETLQVQRNLSHSPLFQIMLILQNNATDTLELPGLTINQVTPESVRTKFDLTLSINEVENNLDLQWEYNTDLFNSSTIERMAIHFDVLLKNLLIAPETNIYELNMLDEAEYRQLITSWNNTKASYKKEKCIHTLFEEQVLQYLDTTAVIFEEKSLTYKQLNEQANQLAHYLINYQSVKPDTLIGICLNRSLDMVISLLAVLKSGSAYVPLDPGYPKARLQYMIDDADLDIVITNNDVINNLSLTISNALCLDEENIKKELVGQLLDNPYVSGLSTENLAYVIYTSGSTGQPKGVMIAHQSVTNFLQVFQEQLNITQGDRWLAVTPISFDIAVLELYLPLLSHGELVIAPQIVTHDGDALAHIIHDNNITIMQATPATWSLLQHSGKIPYLRHALIGGDNLPITLARNIRSSVETLWNVYGPTESTVWSTFAELPKDIDRIIIGKPMNNTQVYVVSECMHPVPIGVQGELLIGGDGLARGYLNRPDLTSEKFIMNPFGKDTNSRLYRTGDLVRWLPNGSLEFIGRIDNQVKIRGFRIELGEIEHTLYKHPYIKDVVVKVCDDLYRDRHLVAYLVLKHGIDKHNHEDIELWRSYLGKTLPSYMIPNTYVVLDKLPLTSNNKIDRRALPNPVFNEQQNQYIEPRTQTESLLCEIWQEILGVEKVGITDNFFHLGGHSLLAVRLTRAIQKQFKQEISIRHLIDTPTIEQLATKLKENQYAEINIKPLIPDLNNRYQVFPLTDVQQAYWLGRKGIFELSDVGTHIYAEIPAFNLDFIRFQKAWNCLIKRHDMLRMVICENGLQKVLETVPEYSIPIIDVRQLNCDMARIELLKIRDLMSHQVFSGNDWPLFDIRLRHLTNNKSVIHLSMDALVVDASSMILISQELTALYENPELILPPLELTFRDYVLAQEKLKETEIYKKSKDYWLARVADFPLRPALPLNINASKITQPKFERRSFKLSADIWSKLIKKAKQYQITPTVLFLGCFAEVLNRWSEYPHFALNLTLFNRIPFHSQINSIVGDFTTLILLEMDFRDINIKFVDRLNNIQKQFWSDLENRYFSGIEMLEALRHETGETVSYPIVVTSTLGLENLDSDNNIFMQTDDDSYNISQTSQVALDIQLTEQEGVLECIWDSVEELFPDGMLDNMLVSLEKLLLNLAKDETYWLKNYQLIELPAKQKKIIESANATDTPLQIGLLHKPLLKQIQYQPNKIAIHTTDKDLSYQELGQRSCRLAYQLQKSGGKPNHLIAIVMEKGWQQVVAALGILEAGAAYLPIDASLPLERIKYLLKAGEVTNVVTIANYIDLIPGEYSIFQIENEYTQSDENIKPILDKKVLPTDLAYVLFTSGSTGQPKGVMIDHQGALNTIQDINQRYKVTNQDSVFGLSNLSFDLSVYDIFGVLGAGGTLVLPKPEEYRDPQSWIQYLSKSSENQGVTLWNTVPALMQMLVDYCDETPASLGLRLVLMSGDWIPIDLPKRIKNLIPAVEIISLGGATEASIWSIFYPIEHIDQNWTSIPYGKALANQQFYVLQHDLSLSPIWVTGDLYIRGIGLAQGYWRDEDKTANSFINHPFTGERLYKTGDRGRLLPDGNIEFMGREDHQVKIQGYRVELGEIEARLKSYPYINEAIVKTYTAGQTKQLVAYVVSITKDTIEFIDEIINYLKETLPHYMVPQHIIPISDIPLTANGKIDHKALPQPDFNDIQSDYFPPGTEIEYELCEIWKELLKIEKISITENFFLLGGDSLLITRMVTNINKFWDINVPLPVVYNEPTIKQIAIHIQNMNNLKASNNSSNVNYVEEIL